MRKLTAQTDEENKIAEKALERLRQFQGFNEQTDSLLVKLIAEKHLSISYWSASSQRVKDQTKLDIEVRENLGILDWIQIKKSSQGQGLGKSLYHAAEKFFRNYNCKLIELTPSGEGKTEFWSKLGFNPKPKGSVIYEKILV